MTQVIKFRQPIFNNGKFREFHYWGIGIEQNGVPTNIHFASFVPNVTNPKDSQMFTGLFDKNGQEIYSGDILQNDGHEDWCCGESGTVRFEPELGSFIVEGIYNKNQHHDVLTCDLVCECRVIGNSYNAKTQ